MQYQWTHVVQPDRHLWVLKRNCAMSPRQLGLCLVCLGLVSLAIASAFALHGAWPVVPFACIEIAALLIAFVVYGRHAADYEKIVVEPQAVTVETASADEVRSVALRPGWLRVEYRGGRRELIRLIEGRNELAVGRFVPDDRRHVLARELKTSLAGLTRA